MKRIALFFVVTLVLTYCKDVTDSNVESDQNARENKPGSKQTAFATDSDVWVGAYFASWNHNGNLHTDEIDWDAFTHLYYFAFTARSDGSLSYSGMTGSRINEMVSAGHNAGKPVLFTVGGWGNYDGFSRAISSGSRSTFVANLVSILEQYGFDGVDLDMEPIRSSDTDNYIAFVNELHAALQDISTPMMSTPAITVATSGDESLFARIHDKIDQINIMTYDLSGAWEGWVSWHNAAVYDGGLTFPGLSRLLPSADGSVKSFLNAGVPASKIGIGIDFYGYVWNGGTGTSTGGVTRPNQAWISAPYVESNVPYHQIMNQYYTDNRRHWDSEAHAVYLSIDPSGSSNDKFISYDDEQTIQAKMDYVRQNNLGGTIIWELTGGYRENNPAGERDNLLQAVKEALHSGSTPDNPPPAGDVTDPEVSIGSPGDGATVSEIVQINIQASDNNELDNVELSIEGETVQTFASSPYTYEWNSSEFTNGTIRIEAVATDLAGNSDLHSISVAVDNSISSPPPSSPSDSPALDVYDDQLVSPWIDVSWNASIDFSSAEEVHSGGRSIKVQQNIWGGLSLLSGNWGNTQDIDPGKYEAVEFTVFAQNEDASITVLLENNSGQTFPRVSYGTVPANQWVTVRVPMVELNPNNQVIHRVDVLEISGSAKTYFIDDMKLIQSGGSDPVPIDIDTPTLASPQNGGNAVNSDLTLNWNGNAPLYRLQVAEDADFQTTFMDETGLAATFYSVNNLSQGETYYWRVRGSDGNGNNSSWSSTWSFTITGSFDNVYENQLENPWMNTSWNASVDFSNGERARSGSRSVKVVQYRWGGLSLHSGSWASPRNIDPSQYEAVEFVVYTIEQSEFGVLLENDWGEQFQRVNHGSVQPHQWEVIRIPMDELNPNNRIIHRLDILELSGSTKTYFIDDIRLVK